MAKKLYDEVPFSKDYNYDELTESEASEIFLTIKEKKRRDRKFAAGEIVKFTVLLMVCIMSICITIFVLDWRELAMAAGTLKLILFIAYRLFINIMVISLCAHEITDSIRFRRVINSRFLIAKGTIADIQKEDVDPDFFHPDGIKALLTVAVSDKEKLSPFDISLHSYDDVVIGDRIVIIYFPNELMRIYLYEPWNKAE